MIKPSDSNLCSIFNVQMTLKQPTKLSNIFLFSYGVNTPIFCPKFPKIGVYTPLTFGIYMNLPRCNCHISSLLGLPDS